MANNNISLNITIVWHLFKSLKYVACIRHDKPSHYVAFVWHTWRTQIKTTHTNSTLTYIRLVFVYTFLYRFLEYSKQMTHSQSPFFAIKQTSKLQNKEVEVTIERSAGSWYTECICTAFVNVNKLNEQHVIMAHCMHKRWATRWNIIAWPYAQAAGAHTHEKWLKQTKHVDNLHGIYW